MMQTRSIAAGDYEWTEVQAEKIKECEARLTAKLAGFSSLVRKETKHCRIFAKQMYGQVTCVAGYRRFRPNVICHASKMHDADSVHRRRRLCMDRGSSRENQRVRSTSDSEAGRIFESDEERNNQGGNYDSIFYIT